MIQPIQTNFGGISYRSRLEARHAIFFNLIGTEYHYEAISLEVVNDGRAVKRYLPDFLLPKVFYRDTTQRGWHVEIKPEGTYNEKLDLVCAESKQPGLLMAGYSVRHDNHFQHGEHRDDSMQFRKCEDCGEVVIGFSFKHYKCPACGGYCCDKLPIEAARFANNYKFEFGGNEPWPTFPQTDGGFPF